MRPLRRNRMIFHRHAVRSFGLGGHALSDWPPSMYEPQRVITSFQLLDWVHSKTSLHVDCPAVYVFGPPFSNCASNSCCSWFNNRYVNIRTVLRLIFIGKNQSPITVWKATLSRNEDKMPRFLDSGSTWGIVLVTLYVIFLAFGLTAICLRLWARRIKKFRLRLNDWAIIVAWVCRFGAPYWWRSLIFV